MLTPAYPGFDVEVEALNADPSPIENLTVPAVIDHLTDVIGGLERPPILMGHSAGGVFTQLMLDRGYGAVGVAINSAPTEGVPVVPLSQLKSTFPVLRTIGRKKAAGFTLEQGRYAFTNTFTEEDQGSVRALPHAGIGARAVGQCAGHAGAWPPRHLRQLQKRRPGAAAVRIRRGGPSHAAQRPTVQRQALQVQHRDRGQGVPRLRPPAARREGLGTDRRRRPGLGRGACAITDPQIRIAAQLLIDGSEPTKISSFDPHRGRLSEAA